MANINSRVFLSGSPVQTTFLGAVRKDLEKLGFGVFSWAESGSLTVAFARWTEVLLTDILVLFDATPMCLMEAGAAMTLSHPVVAIAMDRDKNDDTLWLPTIDHYATWEHAMIHFFEKPATLHIKRKNKRVSL